MWRITTLAGIEYKIQFREACIDRLTQLVVVDAGSTEIDQCIVVVSVNHAINSRQFRLFGRNSTDEDGKVGL